MIITSLKFPVIAFAIFDLYGLRGFQLNLNTSHAFCLAKRSGKAMFFLIK